MERPVLGIDTVTRRPCIAVAGPSLEESRLLAEGGWHAPEILGAIETLLSETGIERGRLGAISVAAGPGSFTGVRIGLATAKGLGFALDIAVEGFSTLEATAGAAALSLERRPAVIAAVLEAGRGEVYGATFEVDGSGVSRLTGDATWKPGAFSAGLPAGALLAGDGAALMRSAGATAEETPVPPLAPWLARRLRDSLPERAAYRPGGPGPNYVRPADVEISRRRP